MFARPCSRPLRTRHVAVLAALCVGCMGSSVGQASAQEVAYTGAWQASPLSVRYALQSWGPDCGPRPGAASEPGGRVTVSAEGSHLRFTGALSGATSACWSDNAEVRRVSASARPESWSASCATIAGNPRGESGRYSFTVRDPNTLSYTERTTYNWQLRDSTCTATRTASRTLTRAVPLAIPSELPPPSEPTVAEPAPEEPSTCVAGAPTALRMRAPEAPVEPGARLCLTARATDAAGCALTNPPIEWRVVGPTGSSGRMDGRCFVTTDNAAEAEGEYRITATLGALEARADVQVHSPDLSGLIAVRDRAPGGQPSAIEHAESERAAGVAAVAPGGSHGQRWLLLGVGLLLLGATVGFSLLVVRARRKSATVATKGSSKDTKGNGDSDPERKSDPLKNSGTALIPKKAQLPGHAASAASRAETMMEAPAPSAAVAPRPAAPVVAASSVGGPLACPVCGVPGTGGERFCAKHGERLVTAAENPVSAAGMICPTCRRGYPPDAEFCPHDRAALVPYTLYRRAETATETLPRICPTCGERYGQHVTFCGKDGASLSSVN